MPNKMHIKDRNFRRSKQLYTTGKGDNTPVGELFIFLTTAVDPVAGGISRLLSLTRDLYVYHPRLPFQLLTERKPGR